LTKATSVAPSKAEPEPVKVTRPGVPLVRQATTDNVDNSKELEQYKAKAEESAREVSELRLEIEDLTKERDFYFEKLREVEIALQDVVDQGKGGDVADAIFKILYATAEGFEPPVDEPAPEAAEDGEH
jgi:RP/EB family microtubule-associated protein